MEITRTYRPEDQAMIDKATEQFLEYDSHLLDRLRKLSIDDADKDTMYRNDPARNMLRDAIVELHSIIMPITTITMNSEEFEESSFSKDNLGAT